MHLQVEQETKRKSYLFLFLNTVLTAKWMIYIHDDVSDPVTEAGPSNSQIRPTLRGSSAQNDEQM